MLFENVFSTKTKTTKNKVIELKNAQCSNKMSDISSKLLRFLTILNKIHMSIIFLDLKLD